MSPFLLAGARSSTPDLLNALILLAGSYLIIEKQSHVIGLSLLFTAFFVRIDSVLFTLTVICYLVLLRRLSFKQLIFISVVLGLLATYAFAYEQIPFKHLFLVQSAFERIHQSDYPSYLLTYLHGYLHGIPTLLYSHLMPVTLIFSVSLYLRRSIITSNWLDPIFLPALFAQLHVGLSYLLHPIIEDRFLIANYMIVIFIFVKTARELANDNKRYSQGIGIPTVA